MNQQLDKYLLKSQNIFDILRKHNYQTNRQENMEAQNTKAMKIQKYNYNKALQKLKKQLQLVSFQANRLLNLMKYVLSKINLKQLKQNDFISNCCQKALAKLDKYSSPLQCLSQANKYFQSVLKTKNVEFSQVEQLRRRLKINLQQLERLDKGYGFYNFESQISKPKAKDVNTVYKKKTLEIIRQYFESLPKLIKKIARTLSINKKDLQLAVTQFNQRNITQCINQISQTQNKLIEEKQEKQEKQINIQITKRILKIFKSITQEFQQFKYKPFGADLKRDCIYLVKIQPDYRMLNSQSNQINSKFEILKSREQIFSIQQAKIVVNLIKMIEEIVTKIAQLYAKISWENYNQRTCEQSQQHLGNLHQKYTQIYTRLNSYTFEQSTQNDMVLSQNFNQSTSKTKKKQQESPLSINEKLSSFKQLLKESQSKENQKKQSLNHLEEQQQQNMDNQEDIKSYYCDKCLVKDKQMQSMSVQLGKKTKQLLEANQSVKILQQNHQRKLLETQNAYTKLLEQKENQYQQRYKTKQHKYQELNGKLQQSQQSLRKSQAQVNQFKQMYQLQQQKSQIAQSRGISLSQQLQSKSKQLQEMRRKLSERAIKQFEGKQPQITNSLTKNFQKQTIAKSMIYDSPEQFQLGQQNLDQSKSNLKNNSSEEGSVNAATITRQKKKIDDNEAQIQKQYDIIKNLESQIQSSRKLLEQIKSQIQGKQLLITSNNQVLRKFSNKHAQLHDISQKIIEKTKQFVALKQQQQQKKKKIERDLERELNQKVNAVNRNIVNHLLQFKLQSFLSSKQPSMKNQKQKVGFLEDQLKIEQQNLSIQTGLLGYLGYQYKNEAGNIEKSLNREDLSSQTSNQRLKVFYEKFCKKLDLQIKVLQINYKVSLIKNKILEKEIEKNQQIIQADKKYLIRNKQQEKQAQIKKKQIQQIQAKNEKTIKQAMSDLALSSKLAGQNQTLKQSNTQLKAQISSLQEKIWSLIVKIEKLHQSNKELKFIKQNKTQEQNFKVREKLSQKDKIVQNSKYSSKIMDIIKEMQKQNEEQTKNIREAYEKEIKQKQNKNAETLKAKSQQIEVLSVLVEEMKAECQEYVSELKTLNDKFNVIQKEKQNFKKDILNLKEEISNLQSTNETLQNQMKQLDEIKTFMMYKLKLPISFSPEKSPTKTSRQKSINQENQNQELNQDKYETQSLGWTISQQDKNEDKQSQFNDLKELEQKNKGIQKKVSYSKIEKSQSNASVTLDSNNSNKCFDQFQQKQMTEPSNKAQQVSPAEKKPDASVKKPIVILKKYKADQAK